MIDTGLLDHARHLAEGMWTPALVLDRYGGIVFFNEGLEILIGARFEETGPMKAADWGSRFNLRATDGSPFPLETMPGWLELQRSQPGLGHARVTTADGRDVLVRVIGTPLFTQLGEFVGAFAHVWEEEQRPGGRLEATLLFGDLRGHTADSSKLEPDRVKELLDVFYEHAGRLINRYEGTLMAFTGDEVFAAWGAPTPDDDGPKKAVACARLLQDSVSALNQKLSARELPSVAFGIGIHTGEVVDAHVGVGKLRQYTVTGDSVNCASRLCSIAGRNEIVVSADLYSTLEEKPPAEKMEGIKFKGVGRDLGPHRLWPDELRDPTGEQRGKLEQ
jgi:class 3 adenylate cyclase